MSREQVVKASRTDHEGNRKDAANYRRAWEGHRRAMV